MKKVRKEMRCSFFFLMGLISRNLSPETGLFVPREEGKGGEYVEGDQIT